MLKLTNLLSGLVSLGVNITEKQVIALKWRLSKDGKKFYTRRETNEFYKAVEKGNTDVIDVARKEKQMKITELKNRLKTLSVVFLLVFFGCTTIPEKDPLTADSLKSDDKSFFIEGNNIKLPDGSLVKIDKKDSANKLSDDWFIVHKDFIKEHNENQDSLIQSLEQQIKLKGTNNLLKGICVGTITLALVLFALLIFMVRKK